jgi:hypothetical protein
MKRALESCGVLVLSFACGACASEQSAACVGPLDPEAPLSANRPGLRFSELLSENEGVNVDEDGETDDWLELENTGTKPVALARYTLSDATGKRHALPDLTLPPGQVLLLWADDDQPQGKAHLPLKLSSKGERLTLWDEGCHAIDRVVLPATPENESYARLSNQDAFSVCRYATPGRSNGASCLPPAPPPPPPDQSFAAFVWPPTWPPAPAPLSLNELSLRGAGFVEVVNTSRETVVLADYALQLAPTRPDAAFPLAGRGRYPSWPQATLEPGQRVVVTLSEADTSELASSPGFEGAAVLTGPSATLVDWVEFSAWPEGAVLARMPDARGSHALCSSATPGASNRCTPVERQVGDDRTHALHAVSDFASLGAGSTVNGQRTVKFVVDLEAHDAVHLIGNQKWPLHYTFVRENVYREPALDRCDPAQARAFLEGWTEFGQREYFAVAGRRFLLGSLIRYANGVQTVEFAAGDKIDATQMRRAFLAAIARTPDPAAWSLRPSADDQVAPMRALEGTLPIVDRNAPFADLTYQALTRAEGFGVLRFVPGDVLADTPLGPDVIVVTDDVPNDVPLVGGLITEAFQAPLAHVNVLSAARGTPNMALRSARAHPRIAPLLGKLVRLEVDAQDFSLREATPIEADAFWQSRRPSGPRVLPPGDLSPRELLPLDGRGLSDLPSIGAKAAQFAELYRLQNDAARFAPPCQGGLTFRVPQLAFAVPVVHYDEHFTHSGARALLHEKLADPSFRADASVRAAGLAEVRKLILGHPVEPGLLSRVSAMVRERFGARRVRLRSSSNTEDLPTFNGAGLHTSISAELDDDEREVDDALRTVWSSLWNLRAYDERESANLEQTASLMGVLVHEQFGGEAAQGVAVSRNLLDLTRDDAYYINTQLGEANVTNPAPGVVTEQLLFSLPPSWEDQVRYQTLSSLSGGATILRPLDMHNVACALRAVHDHFRPLLDPAKRDRLFAMQIEFKLERDRTLVVKQARPQPFGHVALPADCR